MVAVANPGPGTELDSAVRVGAGDPGSSRPRMAVGVVEACRRRVRAHVDKRVDVVLGAAACRRRVRIEVARSDLRVLDLSPEGSQRDGEAATRILVDVEVRVAREASHDALWSGYREAAVVIPLAIARAES